MNGRIGLSAIRVRKRFKSKSGADRMFASTLAPNEVDSIQTPHAARRVLLVAYNFPPVGGAGVQRPVKWVKYLKRWGWDVTVLTTLNPSVPARDESLLADVPTDVRVVRARTWEPDYHTKQNLISAAHDAAPSRLQQFKGAVRNLIRRTVKVALQPDPQVLWNHHAIRAGARVLNEQPHDAILVTAPAYSSFFVGAALKRRFGLPLVLDYRDEWDLSGKYLENAQRDWVSRTVQERMQRHLLRQADAVVATTRRSTRALTERLEALQHLIPAQCIYNGFDAEDFAETDDQTPSEGRICGSLIRQPDEGVFRLVYTGTLWNLTDIEPLVRAIEELHTVRPDLAGRLELVCVGRKTPEQQAVLQRLNRTTVGLESIDYCDHSTALQWLQSAHGVCLLLSDVPGAERVVPAKLFEYLAVRKEILAIAPGGETAELVRHFFPQGHFTPSSTRLISEWLASHIGAGGIGAGLAFTNEQDLLEFSRESQAGQLASLLDSLVMASEDPGRHDRNERRR